MLLRVVRTIYGYMYNDFFFFSLTGRQNILSPYLTRWIFRRIHICCCLLACLTCCRKLLHMVLWHCPVRELYFIGRKYVSLMKLTWCHKLFYIQSVNNVLSTIFIKFIGLRQNIPRNIFHHVLSFRTESTKYEIKLLLMQSRILFWAATTRFKADIFLRLRKIL